MRCASPPLACPDLSPGLYYCLTLVGDWERGPGRHGTEAGLDSKRDGAIDHADLVGTGRAHAVLRRQSRRSFLKIGGLAMGGLSLPELLQAEARRQGGRRRGPRGRRTSR